MPVLKRQVKRETRVDKISNGRLKSPEPIVRGSTKDVTNSWAAIPPTCEGRSFLVAENRVSKNMRNQRWNYERFVLSV